MAVLHLSAFLDDNIFVLDKFLKALNADVVMYSDEICSLEKLSYEDKAVSSTLQTWPKNFRKTVVFV